MDIQLQLGKTDHYCFVTDCAAKARGKGKNARGAIQFNLEFVRPEHIIPDDETSDIENVSEGAQTLTVAEFAAWWEANPEWRVVDV